MRINSDLLIGNSNRDLKTLNTEVECLKGVCLFTGHSNGTITLTDSVANYDYIRIYYSNIDGFHSSLDIHEPNGKLAMLMSIYPLKNAMFAMQGRIVKINNNTISNDTGADRYGEGIVGGTNICRLTDSNLEYIYRVVGFKKVTQ